VTTSWREEEEEEALFIYSNVIIFYYNHNTQEMNLFIRGMNGECKEED
jgi:hypothetical protein